ncbi:hypothetical protein LZ554_009094 [Drepanopeziza brunnea f. sp. 'monogermtubi']|nr:hypothetical protein LZ554_009094 [Drepanopeziza brunnea f. sp. 'monogermtubi']
MPLASKISPIAAHRVPRAGYSRCGFAIRGFYFEMPRMGFPIGLHPHPLCGTGEQNLESEMANLKSNSALDEKVALEIPQRNSGAHSLSSGESFANPTGISEKALVRKLDLKLLPPLTLLYLLSFLDRSNIGNARIEGLTTDLNITGNQYLFTLTIYFIGYVLFEIPCNIILKRTTPRFWLPTLMLAWGIVANLLGVTQNLAGFLAARFFLGVTESGLFPGVVFYLSMWYKRTEVHYRVALFFSAASLAGAFGGILAFGIAKMDDVGGYEGWRWIFILVSTPPLQSFLIRNIEYKTMSPSD